MKKSGTGLEHCVWPAGSLTSNGIGEVILKKTLLIPALILAALSFMASSWADETSAHTDWLDGGNQLTTQAFERLLKQMDRDPKSKAILSEASARLALKSPAELIRHLRIAPPGQSLGLSQAVTHVDIDLSYIPLQTGDLLAGRTILDVPNEPSMNLISWDASAVDFATARSVLVHPARTFVTMQARLSLDSAYIDYYHELVHLSRIENVFTDAKNLGSETTFAEQTMLVRGGEVEAYTEQYGLMARVLGISSLPAQVQSWFDTSGNFLGSRIAMARFILNHPSMSYGSEMKASYPRAVKKTYGDLKDRRGFIEALLDVRRQSVERHGDDESALSKLQESILRLRDRKADTEKDLDIAEERVKALGIDVSGN